MYEKPPWLSRGSLELLHAMLQVSGVNFGHLPWNIQVSLNQSDGPQATDHSAPTSHSPLDDGGLRDPCQVADQVIKLELSSHYISVDSNIHHPGIARQCWTSRWWARWQPTLGFQDRLR